MNNNKLSFNYFIKITLFFLLAFTWLPAQERLLQPRYIVNKIHVQGNESFSGKQLKKQLNFKEKRWLQRTDFTRRLIELGRINLESYYISEGFLNCTVADSFAIGEKGNVDLYYRIKENERFYLAEFTISGNRSIDEKQVRSLFNLAINAPYNPILVRQGIAKLRQKYEDIGKPMVAISDSIRVNGDIKLYLLIQEGPTMSVGSVHINNLDNVKEKCVRREIHLKPGDTYSGDALSLSKKHIYATGLFSSVTISSANIDTSRKTLDLVVDLRQLKMRATEMDIGFGQNRGVSSGSEPYTSFDLNGEWLHRNIFSRGARLSTSLTTSINTSDIYQRPNFETEVSYIEPWLLGFRSSNLFRVFLENQLQDENELLSYGAETALIIQPDKRFYFRTGVEIKDIHYRYEQLVTESSQYDTEQEHALSMTLSNDTRDIFLYPKTGSVVTIDGKLVGTIFGGTQDYYKVETSYSIYRNIFSDIVLALRAKTGIMATFYDEATPEYEKFYLGGETSLRGWDNRTFYNSDGTPLGNDVKVLTNAELRFPLFWLLGGEIFLDGGALASDIAELMNMTYRWNYGFGLTFATPLGPVRVDYARIINPSGTFETENPWQVQFAIPYAF